MTNSTDLQDLPVWDRAGMLERIGGDTDIAMGVLEGFLTTIPDQVNVLKTFMNEGNLNGITHTSHSLKGVAATVGGERLRKIAMHIETAAKNEKLELAQSYLDAFTEEFDVLLEEVSKSDLNPNR